MTWNKRSGRWRRSASRRWTFGSYGEAHEAAVRGHRAWWTSRPSLDGKDVAPTPTELFIVSLATCIAFYAGEYLTRHGFCSNGLGCRSATR